MTISNDPLQYTQQAGMNILQKYKHYKILLTR